MQYEVIREIYNTCANKYFLDSSFDDLVECDDIIAFFTELFSGDLPKYTVEKDGADTDIYTFDMAVPQRFTVSRL